MLTKSMLSKTRNIEDMLHLDLAQFSKTWHRSESSGVLTWRASEAKVCQVAFRINQWSLSLDYVLSNEMPLESVRDTINFGFSDQSFSGRRRWFLCNGCGLRCRVLYLDKRFLCRACCGGVYLSQTGSARITGTFKGERARAKLGVSASRNPRPADKPKGMHWRTFRRLNKDIMDADEAFFEAVRRRI